MSNAGSALMGIGRASGENRAVLAAQQAIESPLLEVSIDGARGILLNVIGGNDLSMHEINAAAEAITSAADPEANIIFGATVNPDIEGEVIITVVATGFDAAYFAKQAQHTGLDTALTDDSSPSVVSSGPTMKDDSVMSDIDTNLDDDEAPEMPAATDFQSQAPVPNIWTMDDKAQARAAADDSDNDRPAPVARPQRDEPDESPDEFRRNQAFVAGDMEDDALDKPSFLRRLTRHKDQIDPKDPRK